MVQRRCVLYLRLHFVELLDATVHAVVDRVFEPSMSALRVGPFSRVIVIREVCTTLPMSPPKLNTVTADFRRSREASELLLVNLTPTGGTQQSPESPLLPCPGCRAASREGPGSRTPTGASGGLLLQAPLQIVSANYDASGNENDNLNAGYITFKLAGPDSLTGYAVEDARGHR